MMFVITLIGVITLGLIAKMVADFKPKKVRVKTKEYLESQRK